MDSKKASAQSLIPPESKPDYRRAFASYLLNTDSITTFEHDGKNLQPLILNTASIATPKS
jgi:hypothetical protein